MVTKDREEQGVGRRMGMEGKEYKLQHQPVVVVSKLAACWDNFQSVSIFKWHNIVQIVFAEAGQQTKYKMKSKTGVMGQKFICPPGDSIMSCRFPLTLTNGTKTGKTNARVCSCREFTCKIAGRKVQILFFLLAYSIFMHRDNTFVWYIKAKRNSHVVIRPY
jgi:hypothetical protein